MRGGEAESLLTGVQGVSGAPSWHRLVPLLQGVTDREGIPSWHTSPRRAHIQRGTGVGGKVGVVPDFYLGESKGVHSFVGFEGHKGEYLEPKDV